MNLSYPKKGALIRLARAAGYAAAAAVIAVGLSQTPLVLEGTSLAIFIPAVGAIFQAADKYIREKRNPSPAPEVVE